MATETQKTIIRENLDVSGPSEREVFAGDEDFYRFIADSVQPDAYPVTGNSPPEARATDEPVSIWNRPFTGLQKVLLLGIVFVAIALLYTVLKSPPNPAAGSPPASNNFIPPAGHHVKSPSDQTTAKVMPSEQQVQNPPRSAEKQTQPLSLKVAHDFYQQQDYQKAYVAYSELSQNFSTSEKDELLRDFFDLKMALCLEKMTPDLRGKYIGSSEDRADHLLQSRSPVIRVIANYRICLMKMQEKQYLKARAAAYQTIALTEAIDYNKDWALSLQRDCHFGVAESITRNVLLLCDADKELPGNLLGKNIDKTDPFAGLGETELRAFLNSGSEKLNSGLLSPQIQKFQNQGASPRWSVVSNGASIEELLARFAANSGYDISWTLGSDSAGVRRRPVSLYLPAATAQQFFSVAAGSAGLLARIDDNHESHRITILNPDEYSSLSENISLLTQEALSIWQRLLVAFHSDEYIPIAHFAMGVLYSRQGRLPEAMAEYKLVANRFSQSSLAPFALLQSGTLKTNLHDYSGAGEDLKELIEQYPDNEISGQTCLYLADATMKSQIYDEAGRLYRKAYNLGLSSQSQAASALGAARCLYEQKDYENATKWLNRYIDIANVHGSNDLYRGYFLLGKTCMALEKPQQACDAFQRALTGQLPREEYIQAVSDSAKGYMQQKSFAEALGVLDGMRSEQLSQKESAGILLLKSKILRQMGLFDKVIATLDNKAEYISDSQLKAELSFELAECHIAKGNLELARRSLAEILVFAEPGPLAHHVTVELADVCLKLDQDAQAISVCSKLLNSEPSEEIRQKALNIMAAAYSRRKDYDKATLALTGRWDKTAEPPDNR